MQKRIIVCCFTLLFSISLWVPSFVLAFDNSNSITLNLELNDEESIEISSNSNIDVLFCDIAHLDSKSTYSASVLLIPFIPDFYQDLKLEFTTPPPDTV